MKKEVVRLGIIAAVALAALAGAAGYYMSGEETKKLAQQASQPPPAPSNLVRPHSHILGPADAKVTIVEFLDPECESCRAMYPMVKQLMAEYTGKVRLVIRYMPFHPNSMYAASALEAAAEQGKYWEMLEVLFANQQQWGSHHAPKPELIPDYARQLGLDMAAFDRTVGSTGHKAMVQTDEADGKALGVTGTPTFFVNGRMLDRLGYEGLKAMIEAELARS